MSDEQKTRYDANDEPADEVEGHMKRFGANDEPGEDAEVEGHMKRFGANDEGDDEVEAHGIRYDDKAGNKYDSPKYD